MENQKTFSIRHLPLPNVSIVLPLPGKEAAGSPPHFYQAVPDFLIKVIEIYSCRQCSPRKQQSS